MMFGRVVVMRNLEGGVVGPLNTGFFSFGIGST